MNPNAEKQSPSLHWRLALLRTAWVILTLIVFGLWVADPLFQGNLDSTGPAFVIGMPLGFFLVAILIFRLRSRDEMALWVSLMLVFIGPFLLSGVSNDWSTRPGWGLISSLLALIGASVTILCLYIFPSGHFVRSWGRYLYGLTLVGLGGASLLDVLYPTPTSWTAICFGALVPFGLGAQVHRYLRASNHVQRQQTKWILLGFAIMFLEFAGWLLLIFPSAQVFANDPWLSLLSSLASTLSILALPFSIALSILRYRLWDIDLIIRRTLIYGALSLLLALVYFGSVVLLQQVFHVITGAQQSEIVTIISTLAIAALFNPLRRRVQETIDHRFYRRKYDAQQVLTRFAATARDEVGLEELTGELLSVVGETMQPTNVSLWMKATEPSMITEGEKRA